MLCPNCGRDALTVCGMPAEPAYMLDGPPEDRTRTVPTHLICGDCHEYWFILPHETPGDALRLILATTPRP